MWIYAEGLWLKYLSSSHCTASFFARQSISTSPHISLLHLLFYDLLKIREALAGWRDSQKTAE